MEVSGLRERPSVKVRETEILSTDNRQQYREKIARITLDAMVQFVGLLDADGTVLEINHVALSAVGVSLKEVENRPFWTTFWWQVSTEINNELRAMIARAAKGEFVRWDTRIYGRAGGKETIIIDASLCPVLDDKGNVVFICAEGRDITEKKAQEREIAQKNIELQGLLERIRELDEVKTQFFANVSHELRTPLALIIGPAERLMKTDGSMTAELQHESANTIVRNAKMLLKHVNDLLDISKLEARKLKIELQHTNVAELVRFVASHFEVLARERNIDYIIETQHSLYGAVDPAKVQRIVMNLLSNAFKFAPEGGAIRCKLDSDPAYLILAVEDSGPGVKPELRKVIFERFRQGDGATNRQFSGTGLGLAIAHEFVEMHKGLIEVSRSGLGGAMFQVKFPKDLLSLNPSLAGGPEIDRTTLDGLLEELRTPSGMANETGEVDTRNGSKAVILVVEDNPDMNRFICQTLAGDFQVVSAFDGDEGLKKALTCLPSMILSDIMMPRVSGVEMIRQIREHPQLKDTLIILLSAKADDELKLQLLRDGAQDYITKPFGEVELLVRVKNLMDVKRSKDVLNSRAQQLSDLFQQTPSFMALLRGADFTFQFANNSYLKLIGRDNIVGKQLLDVVPEIAGQGFDEILKGVLKTGKRYVGKSVPVLLQRNPETKIEQRFVDFVYEPYIEASEVVGVFVEGHDVTEEVRIKNQLIQNESRLEQEVLARTRDLVASNEDLQQFAHVASHDLKEPIRKVRTFSNRLKFEMTDQITEKGKTYLDKILGATERAHSMIDGVLAYSTFNVDAQPIEIVDLNAVMNNLQSDLEIPIAEKQAKIEVGDLPAVEGAPVLLYQLFYNLLNNSLKFSNSSRQPVIKICGSEIEIGGERFANIVINDNGIGFAPEYAEKIFKTFTRLNSKDRYEGTGLGLALCKKIAERHGGSISARAEENVGAEFSVVLPISKSF
jgi:PAS domain S-box-containing protein